LTLREIMETHPHLFYKGTWYTGEPFMNRPASGSVPDEFFLCGTKPNTYAVTAADLALLYVDNPRDPRWRRFLWTADHDRHGQQIYVGGVGEFGIDSFQVHRHLTIDHRWGWVA
jgi:hypothetical protein